MSKRKYKPGRKINSFEGLFVFLGETGFIYARGKIYHEGWVMSWQLKYIKSLIDGGHVRKAVKIK
jgi:hypothetical protein